MPDRERFWGDDRPAYIPPPRKDVRTPDDDGCWLFTLYTLACVLVIGVAVCTLGVVVGG